MEPEIIEANYTLNFREEEARVLGEHLLHRHNVELVGMKRVGISNFLRFFLYHKNVTTTYVGDKNYLFIPVDLNDLVERELFPFWTLTLKRITDAVNSSAAPKSLKSEIEALFLSGIQSQDLFFID